MVLLTKQLVKRFNQIGKQTNIKDPLVIAKLDYGMGELAWYITHYSPTKRKLYGYIAGFGYDGWSYISIDLLEELKASPFISPIKRDTSFKEKHFSKLNL